MSPDESAWREELNALIAAGWGDVPQGEIPVEWRSMKPTIADKDFSSVQRQSVSIGLKKRWVNRRQVKAARQKRLLAKMQLKYQTLMRLGRG